MRRWTLPLALLVALVPALRAQTPDSAAQRLRPPPSVVVTLDEALTQAQANSPDYRIVLNDRDPASADVRAAYGAYLPTADVGGGVNYTGAGSSNFGGTNFEQVSPSIGSSYSIGLGWQFSGRTIAGSGLAKANLRATDRDIDAAGVDLRAAITDQYLNALAAVAQTDAAVQQVQRNQVFLDLARARFEVGQATLIDVRQAEVQKGNSDLNLLRSRQLESEAKLELFRRMGIEAPVDIETVGLVNPFEVIEPTYTLDEMQALALEANPTLQALEARADAAGWNVTAAKSDWLPTLSASAGWNGYTQEFTDEDLLLSNRYNSSVATANNCEFQNAIVENLANPLDPNQFPNGGIIPNCNSAAGLNSAGTALDPAFEQSLRDQNSVFPFEFTNQPFSAQLRVSLPIFTGFSRGARVSAAKAQRSDAEEAVRRARLQLRTDVQGRLLGLRAAYEAIAVQRANRQAAMDQLQLAQDRYRIGSGTALELSDAQTTAQQADSDLINAVYAYHRALIALEATVGRPLR